MKIAAVGREGVDIKRSKSKFRESDNELSSREGKKGSEKIVSCTKEWLKD